MSLLMKQKVLQEIALIPEEKLSDLYTFLHYFRLGIEQEQTPKQEQIMAFAGCWQDMPDEMFADLTAEIAERRNSAFSGRRNRESLVD